MLANIYEILEDHEKAKEFYNKSNTFFALFDEKIISEQSLKHQIEIYENTNC